MAFQSFDTILDECVLALQRGDSVESCLARYPKHGSRLRSLLVLADSVRNAPLPAPRPTAQTVAWNRVRQRAAELRSGKRSRPQVSVGYATWLRPAAIAAAFVCAIMAGGGATAIAAQSSLPDSPLYRVKLATEDAHLWFVFDETHEAEILIDQSAERSDEITSMIEQGKPIPGSVLSALRDRNERATAILEEQPEEITLILSLQQQAAQQEELLVNLQINVAQSARDEYAEAVAAVHTSRLGSATGGFVSVRPEQLAAGVQVFEGLAEQIGQDLWSIGGVEVRVDSSTIDAQSLQAGSTARFVVGKSSRGDLHALSFTYIQADLPPSGSVVSGQIEEINDEGMRIAGQFIRFDANTIRAGLKKGEKAQVTITNTPEGPAAASVKEGDEASTFTFEGTLEGDIKNDQVKVGGLTFNVPPNTKTNLRAGRGEDGARVIVEAEARDDEDEELRAKSVTVLASGAAADSVYLVGVFQGAKKGLWRISGIELIPPENMTEPAEDSIVAIEAKRIDDDIQADRATVLETPDDTGLVHFQGAIISIDGSLWATEFGGVRVTSISTVSGGDAAIGARVLVWARRAQDGSLQASYARVLDETSVITTPTPAPSE